MKYIPFIIMLLTISLHSQNEMKEKEIKQTIATFFDGLHKGDTVLIKKSISPDMKLQTTYTNKEGKAFLKTESKVNFLKQIAAKPEAAVYEEKILDYTILIDDNLASVWTPYEFYYNGELSHCGVNSFQLFNNNGTWQIIYIIDTRKRAGCNIKK